MVGAPLQSASAAIQGQLEVTVVSCINLENKEWISKQDPYVYLEYGNTKFRTKTCTDGGKNLLFQEKFIFTLIEGLHELNVMVWNNHTFSADDLICTGRIQLHRALSQGYDDSAWPLQSKCGRSAGEIRLILYHSKTQSSTTTNTRYAPPAAGYATPNATLSTVLPYGGAPAAPPPAAPAYAAPSPYTTGPPNSTTTSQSPFMTAPPTWATPSPTTTYPPISASAPYPTYSASPIPSTAYPPPTSAAPIPSTTYPPNSATYPPSPFPPTQQAATYPPTPAPPAGYPSQPNLQALQPTSYLPAAGPSSEIYPQPPSTGVYPPPPTAGFYPQHPY